MAKAKDYSSKNESMKSVWNDKGDKRYGFVSRDRVQDPIVADRYYTRYGAGIDNLPLSGYNERSVKTPLGTFDYGNDQDTAFAGFTPNFERTKSPDGFFNYGRVNLGDTMLQAGKQGDRYFAGAFLPGDNQYIPTFDKQFNTPFGSAEIETNYENPNYIDASFAPNQYIQALANILRRGR